MGGKKTISLLSDGASDITLKLTPRQKRLLLSVVKLFIRTERPVSSGKLAKLFHLSSATIRNELAFMEDLGILKKDHKASGRVPTDLAYRFFVDEIKSKLKQDPEDQMRTERALTGLQRELSYLIQGTLSHLCRESGQAAWVSVPVIPDDRISTIDFIRTSERSFLILLVTTNGYAKHRMATLDEAIDTSWLTYLKEQLNNYLSGRLITEVENSEISHIFSEVRKVPRLIIENVSDFLTELGIGREMVFVSDSRPLLAQPEFREAGTINSILDFLYDKDGFNTYIRDVLGDEDLRVVIGSENEESKLRACSLILSRYSLSGTVTGTVGVIGPTRQTYDFNIPLVAVVADCFAELLQEAPFSL